MELTLWTIQREEAFSHLERTGVLRGDWRRVPREWRPASRWMAEQLAMKLGIPSHKPPVWAWHSYESETKRRPDLRHAGHLAAGTRGVRIELRAPAELTLLSDFQKWHCVLNGHYCCLDAAEDARIEALEQGGNLSRGMVVGSWQRIFDLTSGSADSWGPRDERPIQACLPYTKLDWVRRIDHFTAR